MAILAFCGEFSIPQEELQQTFSRLLTCNKAGASMKSIMPAPAVYHERFIPPLRFCCILGPWPFTAFISHRTLSLQNRV